MSNYKTVFFTLGVLLIVLGFSMLVPITIQLIFSTHTLNLVETNNAIMPYIVKQFMKCRVKVCCQQVCTLVQVRVI